MLSNVAVGHTERWADMADDGSDEFVDTVDEYVRVKIKSLDSMKVAFISIDANASVKGLKLAIEAVLHIPRQCQKVIFKGVVMYDFCEITDYLVEDGSEIFVTDFRAFYVFVATGSSVKCLGTTPSLPVETLTARMHSWCHLPTSSRLIHGGIRLQSSICKSTLCVCKSKSDFYINQNHCCK